MTRLAAPILLVAALGGCGEEPQLRVENAWVRLAPVPSRPAAVYFTVRGGPAATQLINVTSSVAVRSEMHDTVTGAGGAKQMRPSGPVAIPALGDVRFAPGGRHVMLFHVNPGIKPPRALPMRFTFANGTRLEVNAPSQAAGAPPPVAE